MRQLIRAELVVVVVVVVVLVVLLLLLHLLVQLGRARVFASQLARRIRLAGPAGGVVVLLVLLPETSLVLLVVKLRLMVERLLR